MIIGEIRYDEAIIILKKSSKKSGNMNGYDAIIKVEHEHLQVRNIRNMHAKGGEAQRYY